MHFCGCVQGCIFSYNQETCITKSTNHVHLLMKPFKSNQMNLIFKFFSWSIGLHETLALLTSQLHPDANHKEDLRFLKDVFSERSLGYLMKVEHIISLEKEQWCQICHKCLLIVKRLHLCHFSLLEHECSGVVEYEHDILCGSLLWVWRSHMCHRFMTNCGIMRNTARLQFCTAPPVWQRM